MAGVSLLGPVFGARYTRLVRFLLDVPVENSMNILGEWSEEGDFAAIFFSDSMSLALSTDL